MGNVLYIRVSNDHISALSARSSGIRFCSRNHFLRWSMDSWNVTDFVFVFFGRSGMHKIRRTAARRKVRTSMAAMRVKEAVSFFFFFFFGSDLYCVTSPRLSTVSTCLLTIYICTGRHAVPCWAPKGTLRPKRRFPGPRRPFGPNHFPSTDSGYRPLHFYLHLAGIHVAVQFERGVATTERAVYPNHCGPSVARPSSYSWGSGCVPVT
jgi:hypothetical protein